jgi:hypothetical protein
MRRVILSLAVLLVFVAALPASAAAGELDKYEVGSATASLSDYRAGAHADFTVSFSLVTEFPDGTVDQTRDISIALPPGLVGNPPGIPRCTQAQLDAGTCPLESQIGITEIRVGGTGSGLLAIYNMPSAGGDFVARFGFRPNFSRPVIIDVRLRPNDHGVTTSLEGIPALAELLSARTTIWGVPSSPSHDLERLREGEENLLTSPRPSTLPPVPFMTNPTSCGTPLHVTVSADSYQQPEDVSVKDATMPPMLGCDSLEFNPSVTLKPTTSQGTSGSGLDYELGLPTQGFELGSISYGSELQRSEITLPEGMTINPSEAVGLGVCSEEDLARETYDSLPNAGCPETSKIGSVTAISPALDKPIEGSLYVAKPFENPFGSLLGLYMVLKVPDRGVLVKLSGKVTLDPITGQIVTLFDHIPMLPVGSFHLHFREGARAPLVSPYACGSYNALSVLSSWSEPAHPVVRENTFQVESGPNHSPCPASSTPPFAPSVIAGTQSNTAGSYSPFYLRIMRGDGEQEITRFSTTMPPGLTGNLTGIPFCPEQAIAAARTKTGREELANPSCPAASEVGHSLVGAGVGEVLAETPGKVYLAGPYRGAALSLVSVTSAVVGPFDLGTVVIRFGLRINPTTAQVEVDSTSSDAIPHILDGIVVHVRDIRVYIDRSKFMINPTSCEPLSISNAIEGAGADIASSADDTTAHLTTRFQAAECHDLKFKPLFSASTSGKTSRTKGASLSVKLTYPKAPFGSQANIRSVRVELPRQLPSRLSTLQKACADTVFDRNPAACPAESRVGYAQAVTPILPEPLTGPAYFVSHGGSKWPELILVLQGYGFTIDLHGETFINRGITSSTFPTVPDQPVTSFQLTLPQGPNSALASPYNLCRITRTIVVKHKARAHGRKARRTAKSVIRALTMPTTFTAQNGLVIHQNTKIAITHCGRRRTHRRR